MIAVDTGFFYALADVQDRYHADAMLWQSSLQEGWITTWPVVTETTYLLANRLGTECAIDWMREVSSGCIAVWDIPKVQVQTIPDLMQRYAQLPMDLADASMVLLAEHLGHGRILTTDERDFGAYRWKQRKPFQNLLAQPDLP